MELIALLSNSEDSFVAEIKELLKKYTLYPLKKVEELEDLHTNIPLSLVLIDTVSHRLSKVNKLLEKLDDDMAILIVQDRPDKFLLEEMPRSVFNCIDISSVPSELPGIVERAIEHQRIKSEVDILKKSKDNPLPDKMSVIGESEADRYHSASRVSSVYSGGKYLQEKLLINFAKMLTVSFDMRKFLNHFMDSVMDIARVNKMSVMLRDKEGFHVEASYGLDPYLADNLKLKKDNHLVIWLSKHGRIISKPGNPADTTAIGIKSEMDLLQCIFSFPMIHKGKLIGIFNIGNKITEEPFYRDELEIMYVFCNYLAAAVKDIDLYHQMWYQKEFTNNILSSMNSGMIAIDRDEKITIFNQQASEILDIISSKILGSDLRNLPSPLGDILYETMVTGKSYKRYEVEIFPQKMSLGINSYRLVDENQSPVGAGIVFTDLSDSKKLEREKRRTEKLEAINDFMAKIAHEVRTPLTSIQTYTQLLSEKYKTDEELENFFSSTVIQSIHKLDSLIDKLVIFSSKPEYNFSKEDINAVLSEAVDYIAKNIPREYEIVKQEIKGNVFIYADRKLLVKALYYLVLSIIEKSPKEKVVTIAARAMMKDTPFVEILLKYGGEEFTKEEKSSLLKHLLEFSHLGTELNVPISHKIIENHNGSLDIGSENGDNILVVKLPIMDRRNITFSIEAENFEQ
jgi:nitrogen-specific signal transduction histidine kinase